MAECSGQVRTEALGRAERNRYVAEAYAALQSDAQFKRHQANVERALSRFESVSEWADFISFLSRLLKALQGAPKFNAIPHKLIVAKRLSQCLNPALPSGVHTRALDVYSHIFSVIGVNGLRRDLPVWTPGLLPLFQNAATSVRPALLDIFDQSYVPLGSDLRPLTRALLLALLPGLEEESSEFFDRVVKLLDQIAASVSREFFLQNIWLVLISSKAIRLSALNYLARRMPKLRGARVDPDISVEGATDTSTDAAEGLPLSTLRPGLLVRGFVHTLGDDSLLVRRNALDFLVVHLPLASQAFAEVDATDRILLVDAAIGAVLRRDISLNRRLYAWLLGPGEGDEQQQAYFDHYALPYVTDALRTAMSHRPSDSAAQQRPYKILVSLMDKGTIGQPLLRTIILDAFHSLVHGTSLNESAELFPTAQMLFESLNSYVLYQQLFFALRDELREPDAKTRYGSAVQLFHEILSVFIHHDEDALSIHLPALYLALVDLMHKKIETRSLRPQLILAVFSLLEKIQKALPSRVYVQHTASTVKPLGYAATYLYVDGGSLENVSTLQDQGQCTQLVDTLLVIGLQLAPRAPWTDQERHAVSQCCFRLLLATLEHLDAARSIPSAGDDAQPNTTSLDQFDTEKWDSRIFTYLAGPLAFEEYVALLKVAMCMANSDVVPGTLGFAAYENYEPVLLPLLEYLQPGHFQQHEEASALFWALKKMSGSDYASSILCSRFLAPATRPATLYALGTLWRLGEASGHAAELAAPMFLVLDQVHSAHVHERKASTRWLHTYVKTYDTLLAMVLDRLVDIRVERAPKTFSAAERSVQAYEYIEPFDQDTQNYYLESLVSLLRLGGAQLLQSAKDTQRGDSDTMDVLTAHLVLLLRSAPPPGDWLEAGNETTHALCLEVLQQILAQASLDRAWCADVQHHLVEALLIALVRHDGAAQMALLDTLFNVVQTRCDTLDEETSALFMELIRRGLLDTPSDAAFFAWTDLVHKLLPHAQNAGNQFLLPLCTCVSELLASAVHQFAQDQGEADWRTAFLPTRLARAERLPTSEPEIVQLVGVVEHVLLQAMAGQQLSESERLAEPELTPSSGFLGNISSVFASESAPSPGNVSPVLRIASLVLHALEYAWVVAKGPAQRFSSSVYEQSTASLERVYRQYTSTTIEAVIENWWVRAYQESEDTCTQVVKRETTALLECLTASPQVLVSSLSDAILSRTAQGTERKRPVPRPLISELVVFRFLEQYIEQLNTESVVQIWPLLSLLAKNISSNHAANKALVYHTLRVVAAAGTPLALSRAYEDRRTRRDLQETFVRLCEQVISLYARMLDISATKRNAKDSDAMSGMDTPEEAGTPSSNVSAAPPPTYIVSFFSTTVLPALGTFAIDTDKIVALCTSLVYYVLTPGFRVRQRTMDVDPLVLEMLTSMSRIPGTIKTWRALVVDTFLDTKFFSLPPSVGKQWTQMLAALYAADRERLVDVIGRVSTAPTNNLFTSRETDLMTRAVSIRRLSYSIYAGERDTFLAQLPLIQEKVVDILRSNAPELVQAEIYLCMRVLLCRFASQHLAGFWPIILTELLRLFGKAKSELPKDNTDAMQLLFSTSKLADYLLTLQTEDFQIHQWLLITDTPDAVHPPQEWVPESLLDCIGRVAIEQLGHPAEDAYAEKPGPQRKPMLAMSRADTMAALEPFFVYVSRVSYDNEFVCSSIDWDNINEALLRDLFEPIMIKS